METCVEVFDIGEKSCGQGIWAQDWPSKNKEWFPASTQIIYEETEPTQYFDDFLLEKIGIIMKLLYRDMLQKRWYLVKAGHLPLQIGPKI